MKALRKSYPDAQILLSNVTETGRKIAAGIHEIDHFIFFPFDLSWVVRKSLNIIRPDVIILVETEIWPNFVPRPRPGKFLSSWLTGESQIDLSRVIGWQVNCCRRFWTLFPITVCSQSRIRDESVTLGLLPDVFV